MAEEDDDQDGHEIVGGSGFELARRLSAACQRSPSNWARSCVGQQRISLEETKIRADGVGIQNQNKRRPDSAEFLESRNSDGRSREVEQICQSSKFVIGQEAAHC